MLSRTLPSLPKIKNAFLELVIRRNEAKQELKQNEER
jgi:hypothetical protein